MYCLLASVMLALTRPRADDRPCVVIVVGRPGTPEYASEFRGLGRLVEGRRREGGRRDRSRSAWATRRAHPIAIACTRS